MDEYTEAGCRFYVPGAIISEVLFVLCRKLAQGILTANEHQKAIQSFLTYSQTLRSSPHGDMALIARADQLRGVADCRSAADGLYIALAEELSKIDSTVLSQWLGERNDLCVVGDASQTIYSFAGATPAYLLGFASLYEDATVVRLDQNYRSTPAIVDAANRIMHGRAGALDLHAVPGAPPGPAPSVSGFADDRAEARAVASAIRADIDGGALPESIAVLYRINVQSAVLEAALGDAGVPCVIRGSMRFFDQREVKEAIMLLKGASVNTRPEPLFQTVSDVLRSLGWTQDAPEVRGAVRDRWESLNALMGLADDSPTETTLKEFVVELLERQAGQHEPTMSAVTLATLHSAKGLEWDCVYIAGASEGLLPIGYAKTDQAIEEERRLFYVGITRARRKLRLSWAGPNREPSRFLADLR